MTAMIKTRKYLYAGWNSNPWSQRIMRSLKPRVQ